MATLADFQNLQCFKCGVICPGSMTICVNANPNSPGGALTRSGYSALCPAHKSQVGTSKSYLDFAKLPEGREVSKPRGLEQPKVALEVTARAIEERQADPPVTKETKPAWFPQASNRTEELLAELQASKANVTRATAAAQTHEARARSLQDSLSKQECLRVEATRAHAEASDALAESKAERSRLLTELADLRKDMLGQKQEMVNFHDQVLSAADTERAFLEEQLREVCSERDIIKEQLKLVNDERLAVKKMDSKRMASAPAEGSSCAGDDHHMAANLQLQIELETTREQLQAAMIRGAPGSNTSETTHLKIELENAQQQLCHAVARLEAVQDNAADAETAKIDLEQELQATKDQLSDLLARADATAAQASELQIALAEATKKDEKYEAMNLQLEMELETTKAQLNAVHGRAENAETALKDAERRAEAAKHDSQVGSGPTQEDHDQLLAELEARHAQLFDAEINCDDARACTYDAEKRIENLGILCERLQEDIAVLQKKLQDAEANSSDAHARAEDAEGRLEKVESAQEADKNYRLYMKQADSGPPTPPVVDVPIQPQTLPEEFLGTSDNNHRTCAQMVSAEQRLEQNQTAPVVAEPSSNATFHVPSHDRLKDAFGVIRAELLDAEVNCEDAQHRAEDAELKIGDLQRRLVIESQRTCDVEQYLQAATVRFQREMEELDERTAADKAADAEELLRCKAELQAVKGRLAAKITSGESSQNSSSEGPTQTPNPATQDTDREIDQLRSEVAALQEERMGLEKELSIALEEMDNQKTMYLGQKHAWHTAFVSQYVRVLSTTAQRFISVESAGLREKKLRSEMASANAQVASLETQLETLQTRTVQAHEAASTDDEEEIEQLKQHRRALSQRIISLEDSFDILQRQYNQALAREAELKLHADEADAAHSNMLLKFNASQRELSNVLVECASVSGDREFQQEELVECSEAPAKALVDEASESMREASTKDMPLQSKATQNPKGDGRKAASPRVVSKRASSPNSNKPKNLDSKVQEPRATSPRATSPRAESSRASSPRTLIVKTASVAKIAARLASATQKQKTPSASPPPRVTDRSNGVSQDRLKRGTSPSQKNSRGPASSSREKSPPRPNAAIGRLEKSSGKSSSQELSGSQSSLSAAQPRYRLPPRAQQFTPALRNAAVGNRSGASANDG